jgi:hypothetical protein
VGHRADPRPVSPRRVLRHHLHPRLSASNIRASSSTFPPSPPLSFLLVFCFFSSSSTGLFYLLLVSLVQTRVLLLDSLPIVRTLFFLSLMPVTDNLCRLALWRIARFVCSFDVVSAPSLFHSLRFVFVVWLSTELVDVLTGESLPWFVLHLLLRIFLLTENNLDV